MKILVIGAEGQVGTFLVRDLSAHHEVSGTSLLGAAPYPRLDICDREAVQTYLERLRPEYVVLTAAFTHVDQCEKKPQAAEAINVRGPENVALACRRVQAGLAFFSTDYIFDGTGGPYAESDAPHPLSVYGRTKWEAEQAVAANLENHLIIRTMNVYSYLPGSLNLFMQLVDRTRKGEPVSGPVDQMINPTQAVNLAQALGELVETGQKGIFNLAGTTRLSRVDFVRRVVAELGYDPRQVKSQTTAEMSLPAARPLQSGLKTDKAQAVLKQNKLWDLDTALRFTFSQMSGHPA
ncbi:MAG: NAD(P)-dependent oxidoreductase [Candidatus Firestonebacteria bacterium]|nr:NAD(P)-dependent oxidoreductase [Candidatus Firestonebacteria bacterium]